MSLDIQGLGVKFYSSKSKLEALALATLPDESKREPGAICFVSDDTGNYIIVNGKIFGDGAGGGGSGGGGAVDSVNGKTGVVILLLGDFPVVVNLSGTVLKTLADYFAADGSIITTNLTILDTEGNNVITIDEQGIKTGNVYYATESYVTDAIGSNNTYISGVAQDKATAAENAAKAYADSLIASVYRVKGSVQNQNALQSIENPLIGDVYNVATTGMNYVYTEDGWDALGGSIDLSNYKTRTESDLDIADALTAAKAYTDSTVSDMESAIGMNTTAISALSGTVLQNTQSIANNSDNISHNTTNIELIATRLTWQ